MVRLKDGVDIAGVGAELMLALLVAQQAYEKNGVADITITAARDGVHHPGSKHYVGMALDLRTTAAGIERQKVLAIIADMKAALGAQFDVIAEADHIHVELDPKVGKL